MRHSAVAVIGTLALAFASASHAQEADTTARAPRDTVLARARQLVLEGRDTDGRRLIDSVLSTLTPDSTRYAETLYWRAVLAATAADAERDYRRLLIEAPLSARAEDAMLQLAQLEQARGDRRGASDHLQRYLLSYPEGAARARVSVQLVRLLFEQGPQQLARACEALRAARVDVPAANVELRNQLEAQAPRCAYVEMAPAPPPPTPVVDSMPPALPARVPATGRDTAGAPRPVAVGRATASADTAAFYSVQVAAYDSHESATRMVQQLASRGIDARVDGGSAPYRVRVGKYPTRADAVKAANDLKAKGQNGFVTLVNPSPR